MNFNAISPFGPHIAGFVRIACESNAADARQLDYFDILDRVHGKPADDGSHALRPHPITDRFGATPGATGQIREIPIHLMFNRPENNLGARYEAFDTDVSRLVCAGDGTRACRASVDSGVVGETECSGPDCCSFANSSGIRCGLRVRLKVKIDGQADPLAVFEVQSGGVNSYGTLSAKLEMMHALFGDRLRHVPLKLTIWTKTSALSSYLPFQCLDLQLADPTDLNKTVLEAAALARAEAESGINFDAMENTVAAMRKNAPLSLDDTEDAGMPYLSRARAGKKANAELAAETLQAAMKKAREVTPPTIVEAPPSAVAADSPVPDKTLAAPSTRVPTPPIEF